MSYFYWTCPTCTLKGCGSLAPPTEIEPMRLFLLVEQLLLWEIFAFEILCSLRSLPSPPPLSPYLTRPEWGHNMILQQSSQVQVSIRFQTHSRWFHWWERAPLNKREDHWDQLLGWNESTRAKDWHGLEWGAIRVLCSIWENCSFIWGKTNKTEPIVGLFMSHAQKHKILEMSNILLEQQMRLIFVRSSLLIFAPGAVMKASCELHNLSFNLFPFPLLQCALDVCTRLFSLELQHL